VTPTEIVTNESGTYSLDKRNAADLAGGRPHLRSRRLFRHRGDVITTAITTGTGKMGIRVSYTD
jgi:hypothetical protein